jgi:DNA (cytosine-5)-methyltransferase 1
VSLTVGSLFSGIGGLDLGLERAGMNVIWQSEIDPYASRVLAKHWPEVPNYGNIKNIRWRDVVRPDVICGGYPCQPFSTAGKRQGTDDPRHLWPWVREAISELRPQYAILENVRGHVSLGLSTVLGEMASIGYDAEWQIVSAASVGAPHRRDRVIIVAYPCEQLKHGRGHLNSQSTPRQRQALQESPSGGGSISANTIGQLANPDNSGHIHRQPQIFTTENWLNALSLIGSSGTDVAYADSSDEANGRQRKAIPSQNTGWGNDRGRSRSDIGEVSVGSTREAASDAANTDSFWGYKQQEGQVQEPNIGRCSEGQGNMANTDTWETSRGLRGVSTDTGQVRSERNNARGEESHASRQWWAVEPDVGRVAHGVSSRVDRLKGLGNAVVPQVAELVGRMVMEHSRTC